MEKDCHERFCNFLLRHNLTVSQIQEIVLDYANSESSFARSHFVKKYEISEHVFYKCRDYAISCHLVDDKVCNLLRKKVNQNYRAHNPNDSARASNNHFIGLMEQRKAFLLSFSNNDIYAIAEMYVYGMCIDQIAHVHQTGKSAIGKLLFKGITQLIFDSPMVAKIIKLMPASSIQIESMLGLRSATRNRILNIQSKEIEVLKYKISNYDTYFITDSQRPSLDSLKKELDLAKKRYEKTVTW